MRREAYRIWIAFACSVSVASGLVLWVEGEHTFGAFGNIELFFEPTNTLVVVALVHKNQPEVGHNGSIFSIAFDGAVDLETDDVRS